MVRIMTLKYNNDCSWETEMVNRISKFGNYLFTITCAVNNMDSVAETRLPKLVELFLIGSGCT